MLADLEAMNVRATIRRTAARACRHINGDPPSSPMGGSAGRRRQATSAKRCTARSTPFALNFKDSGDAADELTCDALRDALDGARRADHGRVAEDIAERARVKKTARYVISSRPDSTGNKYTTTSGCARRCANDGRAQAPGNRLLP
jgi:hypothetical protein